ncbi:hypothetical protein J6G99_05735 [bacterium]|nr:hypothetical protein [bacterium]
MIFSWNKNCPLSDPDVVSNNTDGNTYDCMKGIVDLNGFRGPNKVNKDIIKFGANGVIANGKGDGCLFKTSKNKCLILPPNEFKPATKEECIAMANSGYGNNKNYCGLSTDYWAGAVRACGGKSKMASVSDLQELSNDIYRTPNYSRKVLEERMKTLNISEYINWSGRSFGFCIWSSVENNATYAGRRCYENTSSYYQENVTKKESGINQLGVICISD